MRGAQPHAPLSWTIENQSSQSPKGDKSLISHHWTPKPKHCNYIHTAFIYTPCTDNLIKSISCNLSTVNFLCSTASWYRNKLNNILQLIHIQYFIFTVWRYHLHKMKILKSWLWQGTIEGKVELYVYCYICTYTQKIWQKKPCQKVVNLTNFWRAKLLISLATKTSFWWTKKLPRQKTVKWQENARQEKDCQINDQI